MRWAVTDVLSMAARQVLRRLLRARAGEAVNAGFHPIENSINKALVDGLRRVLVKAGSRYVLTIVQFVYTVMLGRTFFRWLKGVTSVS
jgi:hypothetical protein